MKKVVFSAFAFVLISVASANAQTETKTQGTTQTQGTTKTDSTAKTPPAPSTAIVEETKTEITVAELPEAVKTTLASPALKSWTAYEAYLIKESDGDEYYAINIKNNDKTGSVKLDKEGKPVK